MTQIDEAVQNVETTTEEKLKADLEQVKAELEKWKAASARIPLIEELDKVTTELETIKKDVTSRISAIRERRSQTSAPTA
jgi:predicted  nucleic acid-binding Zn-ribbon protein